MIKKSILALTFSGILAACGSETPEVKNATPVGEREWVKSETGDKKEELKANAIPIENTQALVSYSLQTLQEVYSKASGKVPGVGNVTVLVDDNLNLIVKNVVSGDTYLTTANLKSLNSDPAKLGIIVDKNPGEFPGLKVYVRQGEPRVSITKNGKEEKKQDFLEVKLAERSDVERVASAILQAVESAQGTMAEEGTKNK